MMKVHVVIGSVFGIGYFPIASATAATLVQASWIYVFFNKATIVEVPLFVVLFFIAVKSAGEAEKILGHDASEIVIDEICGFMVTLFLLDRSSLQVILVAFFLFRFFDVLKPWPIRRSQRLHGGLGIVIDDVLAGVYSNIVLRLLLALGII
ncbi:MAG: phosphatidylglycerophosphatase A [Candidatus Glassbacteria bacterium]